MTTLNVADSLVVASGGKEAIAGRLLDGKEMWRVRLPDCSPMANPSAWSM
jgi:hypothetical protein